MIYFIEEEQRELIRKSSELLVACTEEIQELTKSHPNSERINDLCEMQYHAVAAIRLALSLEKNAPSLKKLDAYHKKQIKDQ